MVTTLAANPIFDRRTIPSNATESFWQAGDGWPIRRIDWPPSLTATAGLRGSILFLPGRGDHYEKYLETLDYFARRGWRVTSIDWRGQGDSGRLLADRNVGYIDDFSIWIADLRRFYSGWKTEADGPNVVIAHSMGGHLAMRAAIEQAIDPDALVLSAPMLSIRTGGLPLWLNQAAAKFMVSLGRGERPAWKTAEKPRSTNALRRLMLTHDKKRYADEIAWWDIRPQVRLGPGSWRWIERAIASIRYIHQDGKLESMHIPTLIMATTADQLVSTPQILTDTKRLPDCEILLFGKEAAHELLRESDDVRDKCLGSINSFLDRAAPAR
jgi:lysophospholipase